MKRTVFSFIILFTFASLSFAQKPINVTFISVAKKNDIFWNLMTDLGQAAAKDLNINLEVIYSDRNHFNAVKIAEKVLSRKEKPDYLIVVAEKLIGSKSIVLANKFNVKTVLFGALTAEETLTMGTPREHYQSWIGQMKIDDFEAGYLEAKSLIQSATQNKLTDSDNKLYMLGLAGVYKTSFNKNRIAGLHKALAEHPDVILLQMIPAYWSESKAEKVIQGALKRYQNKKIGLIWSANTYMALGALKAVKKNGLRPNADIVISGIDFIEEGLEKVKSKELDSTVGGHFANLAWIMVMIHDYHNHIDFKDENDKTAMFVLNHHNSGIILNFFKNRDWDKIDFRKFSKVFNPNLKQYHFSTQKIIDQF